jgi:uridine phosphorylase
MKSVYHLHLTDKQIEGAKIALLPGDPARVEKIARTAPLERPRFLASKREYTTWLSYIGQTPVLTTSTGIGGPSTAIAVEELAQLGVRIFIRVGTTGAIQPHINISDVVITTGAVRLDGASTHYAPIEYPAVADYEIVRALIQAARKLQIPYHVGITCSSDTFYPGQERYDTFSGYVPRHLRGSLEEWRHLNVLNYEMEAATLFVMCNALGLRAGCVAGVAAQRTRSESVALDQLQMSEENAIRVAAKAVEILIQSGLG